MSDRDSWGTPSWLTDLLPEVDLDPCSNPFSTVRARRTYSLENGQDGLSLPWNGSTFTNPPFSNINPWALKLLLEDRGHAAAFLVNVDPSVTWWRTLTARLGCALMFRRRIQFRPPPGVQPSTNSKAQALLMNEAFFSLCSDDLLKHGALWHSRRAA